MDAQTRYRRRWLLDHTEMEKSWLFYYTSYNGTQIISIVYLYGNKKRKESKNANTTYKGIQQNITFVVNTTQSVADLIRSVGKLSPYRISKTADEKHKYKLAD